MTDVAEVGRELADSLCGDVKRDLALAPYTTYRIGGPADLALFPQDPEDLARAIHTLGRLSVPWVMLGGGSNVLISDRGVRGAVVLTTRLRRLDVNGQQLTAGAGEESHRVAVTAREAGLAGAAFLAWLPGSIGGACLMNARAHGGEVSQVLRRARVVTRQGVMEEMSLAPEQFAYKRSPFQERDVVIAEVTFTLVPGDPATLQRAMDRIEAQRRANHEMDFPSCGCVFKNDYDIGVSSGELIDRCGLKGYSVGDASVSPHHANFVINHGDAKATDVYRVIEHVQASVEASTGHRLDLEVRLVGEWDDDDQKV